MSSRSWRLRGGAFSVWLETAAAAAALVLAEAKSELMSSSLAQRSDVDEPYSHSEWRLAQLEQDGRASSHYGVSGMYPYICGSFHTFTRRLLHSTQPWRDFRCGRRSAMSCNWSHVTM